LDHINVFSFKFSIECYLLKTTLVCIYLFVYATINENNIITPAINENSMITLTTMI